MNFKQGVSVYKLFFLIINLSCWLSAADVLKQGHEAGKWSMDFQAVSEYAEKNEKPIFINFTGSDWCGWCEVMERDVFSDPAWSQFAKDNLSLAYIDFPRDKSKVPVAFHQSNEELRESLKVQSYPTYIILSPGGSQILGKLGALSGSNAASFINQVKSFLPGPEGKLPEFTLLEHQNEEVDSLNGKLQDFILADKFTRKIVYEDTYDKLKKINYKRPDFIQYIK